jgi:hypothetical protein
MAPPLAAMTAASLVSKESMRLLKKDWGISIHSLEVVVGKPWNKKAIGKGPNFETS